MRMIFALSICLAASTAMAGETTLSLKGIAPGMSLSDIDKITSDFSVTCLSLKIENAATDIAYCNYVPMQFEGNRGHPPLNSFADAIPSMWAFSGMRGVIYSVAITTPETGFPAILAALKAKYGDPKLAATMLQNNFGAKFENTIAHWTRGTQSLRLERYGTDFQQSMLLLTDSRMLFTKPPSKDL